MIMEQVRAMTGLELDKGAGMPSDLVIRTSRQEGVLVLHYAGDLSLANLATARDDLRGRLTEAGKQPRILIDMEGVKFADSSGLGFFIAALKTVREAGGDLKVVNLNAYLLAIFRLINLNYIIDCYDSLDRAVASFERA